MIAKIGVYDSNKYLIPDNLHLYRQLDDHVLPEFVHVLEVNFDEVFFLNFIKRLAKISSTNYVSQKEIYS